MEQFIKYIDSQLPEKHGDKLLFKFKRMVLDEMNIRYSEVMQRGITNPKVMTDLVISEYPNLKGDFAKYKAQQNAGARAKRKVILNVAGSIIYILSLIIFFLGISFATHDWRQTWLIPVDGILIWIAYLLTLVIKKIVSLKRVFHAFARIPLAIAVMVVTVAVFLFVMVMFGLSNSWLIVIAGIAFMFIADAGFAVYNKQKLAIMSILAYIPVIATMLYIILAVAGVVAWTNGWLLIIIGLLADFIIIAAAIGKNKQQEQEVIDSWKEG